MLNNKNGLQQRMGEGPAAIYSLFATDNNSGIRQY